MTPSQGVVFVASIQGLPAAPVPGHLPQRELAEPAPDPGRRAQQVMAVTAAGAAATVLAASEASNRLYATADL